MLNKFELCKHNELRVLFYIQSVRVQGAHCVVDVYDYCSRLFGVLTKNTNLGRDYSIESHYSYYFIIDMNFIVYL